MAIYVLHKALFFLNNTRRVSNNLYSLCVNNQQLQCRILEWSHLNSKRNSSDIAGIDDFTPAKKKKLFVPKVTLLSEKNNISVVTLEEAEKIAKRRDFKLIKIVDFDTKSQRPIYKLMNINEFIMTEAKNKSKAKVEKKNEIKPDKTISVSTKISENDLEVKIKSIRKILGKKHGVRIVVTVDGNNDKATEIINHVLKDTKDVAKEIKTEKSGFALKAILRPIINDSKKENVDNIN